MEARQGGHLVPRDGQTRPLDDGWRQRQQCHEQDCRSHSGARQQVRGSVAAPAAGEDGAVGTEAGAAEEQQRAVGAGRIRAILPGHDIEECKFLKIN